MINCIYIAASANDARFTRICVASIRYFYPEVAIKLLVGGRLEKGLANELQHHWNVELSEVPAADWGWGFVKLEPLFRPSGERFLVLDSDTVFVGDVLSAISEVRADFVVDDEEQSGADTLRIYYDSSKAAKLGFVGDKPSFVANTGQWFGTSGVLTHDDFAGLIDWSSMPPKVMHPDVFKNGEQGVLNYVWNDKSRLGAISVTRKKIMHWPGHGMDGISAKSISNGTATPVVVHWAGLKCHRLKAMPGADVLNFFEKSYYRKVRYGTVLKLCRAMRYFCQGTLRDYSTRLHQFTKRHTGE